MVAKNLVQIAVFLIYTLCEQAQPSPFDRKEFRIPRGNAGVNTTVDPATAQQQRSKLMDMRIENIRRTILAKLNISNPKRDLNNTHAISAEEIIRRLQQGKLSIGGPETGGATEEPLRTTPKAPPPEPDSAEETTEIKARSEKPTECGAGEAVQFRLQGEEGNSNLHVTSANLKVLVRYKKSRNGTKNRSRRVEIKIYHLPLSVGVDSQAPMRRASVITTLRVTVRHTKWQTLFLPTTVVQHVLDSPDKVLCVRIECEKCGNGINTVLVSRRKKLGRKGPEPSRRKRKSRQSRKNPGRSRDRRQRERPKRGRKNERLSKRRPYLLIHTRPKSIFRYRNLKKRDVPQVEEAGGAGTCRAEPLYIDFSQLGWNEWIAYPHGYEANFCSGTCGLAADRNGDLYSSQGETMLLDDITSQEQRLCCKPSFQKPLQIMYFDQDQKLMMTELPDMIIDRCQCS